MKYNNDFTQFSGLQGVEAQILDKWLEQNDFYQNIQQENELSLNSENYSNEELEMLEKAVSEFDRDLAPKQIRIWSNSLVNSEMLPPNFVILEQGENDKWLIAPFSPMSLPATNKEMSTNCDIPFCDVLQCWNTMEVYSCLVQQSWLIDEMSNETIQIAKKLSQNILDKKQMRNAKLLYGGGIFNEFDPRHQYVETSKEQYKLLLEKVSTMEKWRNSSRLNFVDKIATPDGIIAFAAKSKKETKNFEFNVDGLNCKISLIIPDKDDLELLIFDLNGNDFTELDGATIRNSNDLTIATIEDGNAIIPQELFDGTLLIINKDGYPIKLTM